MTTPATTTAFLNATLVTATGEEVDGAAVLIADGKVVAAGPSADVDIPNDADRVDLTGSWITAGLVEAHGHIGIAEEANGPAGDDTNEMTRPVTAGVRAIDAVNIEDEGFVDALLGGVTTVVVKPGSGNPIGGQTVAIKTWGGRTIDEQLVSDAVSIKSALGENPKRVYGGKDQTPSTRLGVALIIRQALTGAQDYLARRDRAERDGELFERDVHQEALVRVLQGELAWDQHSHRHDDIATAIRLADEFGYRLVLNHGTEGHKVAGVLAERDVPVIYGPMLTSRSKVELRDRAATNLVELDRAGVRTAITTDHPVVPINLLILQASLAVRAGLPRASAFRALTSNPAEFLGLAPRVGALEPGADADLVVWSGDPLNPMQHVTRVLIEGVEMLRQDESGVHVTPRFPEAPAGVIR